MLEEDGTGCGADSDRGSDSGGGLWSEAFGLGRGNRHCVKLWEVEEDEEEEEEVEGGGGSDGGRGGSDGSGCGGGGGGGGGTGRTGV